MTTQITQNPCPLAPFDAVRVLEGQYRGKEGVVLVSFHMGAEVVIDHQTHWFHREELEILVTV